MTFSHSLQLTSYLAMKNPEWQSKVGASDSVQWPTGLGGKGNDGVSAFVKQTVGSIGYVEYAYAKQNRETYALVQNKAGQFPAPTAAMPSGSTNCPSPLPFVPHLYRNRPLLSNTCTR